MQSTIDPLGAALQAHLEGAPSALIEVISEHAESDPLEAAYFFRSVKDMNPIEQQALDLCQGHVLDVGAGAGAHCLALQERGLSVVGLDYSAGAAAVMRHRGVETVWHNDFFALEEGQFDTLLLLMNGIGIVGELDRLPDFFEKAKQLLAPKGQLVLDSSDLAHLYPNRSPEQFAEDDRYYGEITYQMRYGPAMGTEFDWLFLDFDTLATNAAMAGMVAEKLQEEEFGHYLARITFPG